MKRLLLLITLTFGLSGCIPYFTTEGALDKVMPCLLELVVTGDVEAAQSCFIVAGAGVARDVLLQELEAYLATVEDKTLQTLYEVLFGKSAQNIPTLPFANEDRLERVSARLASWLPERPTLENSLFQ